MLAEAWSRPTPSRWPDVTRNVAPTCIPGQKACSKSSDSSATVASPSGAGSCVCASPPSPDVMTRPTRLPQLARQQAVHHAVAAGSLEGHVGTKKALTGKPATLGDLLRRLIVGTAREFQPGQSQFSECPPGEQADRMCRETPAATLGGEPVSDRRAAMIQANLLQRDAAEHRGLIARLDQRKAQPLAAQAGLFLLSEEVARIGLGVRSSTP